MKTRKIEGRLCELDMTPLVDIVFLMLSLCMIVTYFQHAKADERVKLPYDMLARPPEIEREHELVLNFGYRRSSNGQRRDAVPRLVINERLVGTRDLGTELDDQKQTLQSRLGKNALASVTVLIRADSDVPAGLVQELIAKCRESGFGRFSLQTTAIER